MDQLIEALVKENNSIISAAVSTGHVTGISNAIYEQLFSKLLSKMRGFAPAPDILSFELAVCFNYFAVQAMEQWGCRSESPGCADSDNAVSNGQHESIGCVPFSKKSTDSSVTLSVSDVMICLTERIMQLKRRSQHDILLESSESSTLASSTKWLLSEASSLWFPDEGRFFVISIAIVIVFLLLREEEVLAAAELSSLMLEMVSSPLNTILQNGCGGCPFHLFPLLPTADLPADFSHSLHCIVHLLVAVTAYHEADWRAVLDHLAEIKAVEFTGFCCYLKGVVLLKQKNYVECCTELSSLCGSQMVHPSLYYAGVCLLGDCYVQQNKRHSAVQMYKRSLMRDFSKLMPLWLISNQYRHLAMTDAELEALELLAKILKTGDKSASTSKPKTSNKRFLLDIDHLLTVVSAEQVTLSEAQVLYTLASRCSQLGRYEMSAEKYADLLSSLRISDTGKVTSTSIPSIEVVYLEAVRAHMKAEMFEQSETLSDTFLTKFGWSNVGPSDIREPISGIVSFDDNRTGHSSVKRLHSTAAAGFSSDDGVHSANVDTIAANIVLCRAEALLRLGRSTEALSSIDSVITTTESRLIEAHSDQLPPSAKRPRCEQGVENDDTAASLKRLLSDAYSLKAQILSSVQRYPESVHWARMAAALCVDMGLESNTGQTLVKQGFFANTPKQPRAWFDTDFARGEFILSEGVMMKYGHILWHADDMDKSYVLTRCLIDANRHEEAYNYWLAKRGNDVATLDCRRVEALVKEKTSVLREIKLEETTTGVKNACSRQTSASYTAMDLDALNSLLSSIGHSSSTLAT